LHAPLPSSGIDIGATGITGCAEARDALPPEGRRLLACPSGTDISVDGVPFIAMGGDIRVKAPLENSRAYTVKIPVGRNCPVSGSCPIARVAWEASPRTALAGRDYDTDYGWGEPSYADGGGNFPVDSGVEFGRGEVYWESASKANGTRGVLTWEEGEHGLKMITVNVLRLGGWRPSRFVSFGVGLVEGVYHPGKRTIGVTIAGCVERYAAARPALAGSFGSSDGADQFDGQPGSCRSESEARCGDAVLTQVEECDDGNSISGDGCSGTCTVEAMYTCAGGTLTSADVCSRDRALEESTQWLEPDVDAVSR
jgi:cysteine-rich repeat protein